VKKRKLFTIIRTYTHYHKIIQNNSTIEARVNHSLLLSIVKESNVEWAEAASMEYGMERNN
jgi:hypothetical protein